MLTLTDNQKDFYKNLANSGKKNRLIALRSDIIEYNKVLANTYLADNRKTSVKTLWDNNLDEISFINSLIGLDVNNFGW